MNPFSHTLLFGTVLLLTLKELTEACSCLRSHPQEHFCRADVVMRAKVISGALTNEQDINGKIKYGIQVIEMFKGSEKIQNIDSVFTATESSLCGIELQVKNEYILTGNLREKEVTVNLCGWNEPWVHVSAFQVKGVKGTYQMGCKCKITHCFGKLCDTHPPNECILNDQGLGVEETKNNACIQTNEGSCNWYPRPPAKKPNVGSYP